MPAKEIDYSKTIIYKIVCNDLTISDLYIGHTTHFTRRKNEHKCRYNADNKFKIYQTIRENGGWLNWSMVQIEEFNCNNSNEAKARERYWYEQLHATLNMCFPQRDGCEYYDHNKQKITEYQKQYRELNPDKIKERTKKWREQNKIKIKEKAKQLRDQNKNICYNCECGSTIKAINKVVHNKSKKHKNYIEHLDS